MDARDVEALLALLADEVPVVPCTPAGLVPIAKAAEKARATGIEILHLVLGGFLAGARRLESVAGVGALLVDPEEIRPLIRLHMTGLSPQEVFGRLRIPVRSGWALTDADLPGGPLLTPVVVPGPNGRHAFRRFKEEEVDARVARVVSIPTLTAACMLSGEMIRARLKSARVRPVRDPRLIGADLYPISDLPPDLAPERARRSEPEFALA